MNKVFYDMRGLQRMEKQVGRMGSRRGMEQIGQKVRSLNEDQIDKQLEATGQRVKPYTPGYAAAKGESKVTYVSRKLKGGKFSGQGHMMDAFGVVTRPGRAIIGFQGRAAKKKAQFNANHRNFIGLTSKNVKKLYKWVYKKFIAR